MYSRKAPPRFQSPNIPLAPPTSGTRSFTEPQQGANIMPGAVQNSGPSNGSYSQMSQIQNPTQFPNGNHPPQTQHQMHRQEDGQNPHYPQQLQHQMPPPFPPPPQHSNQSQYSGYPPQPPPGNQFRNDHNGQQSASNTCRDSVNAQIYRIDGNKKLIEFLSNLVPANPNDFANIHGRGGSKYAPKSTINIVMNDYSGKGTQTGTVTVRYSMEWQDIEILLDRAIRAENGELHPPFGQQRKFGEPWSSYGPFEKNHGHYSSNEDGTVAVFRLEIHYTPFKSNGEVSSYPWCIAISNFDAPKIDNGIGTIMHKSSQAKKMKRVFINVSTLEFRRAMVSVSHYIRNWEIAMSVQNIQKGSEMMYQQRQSRRAKT